MVEISVKANEDKLSEVLDFVESRLNEVGCSQKAMIQICIAIEELFTNIVSYGYTGEKGTVVVRYETVGNRAEITLIDDGVEYNPLLKEDPDVTLPPEKRAIGGLGIFMVKKSMDDVKYSYEDNKNIITIYKELK